jgi:hypothetical protein
MTPEEVAAKVAQVEADNAAALGQMGLAALDSWRMILEMLEGWVQVTMQAGYSEDQARSMVAAQFATNCKAAS